MIVFYTDSAVRGNPSDLGAWAFFIMRENGGLSTPVCEVKAMGLIPGKTTNNMAEYTAIIKAIQYAKSVGIGDFKIRSDSSLAINQILGKFKVKNSGLVPFHQKVSEECIGIENIEFEWVPRSNRGITLVDAYCNRALDSDPALVGEADIKLKGKDF